jgi:transposase
MVNNDMLGRKESKMPRNHPPYPPEFRRQMVELVRAGRMPSELALEFEPSAESIRQWVKQAESERGQLIALTAQLAEPELSVEARLGIAAQMRYLLVGEALALDPFPLNDDGRKQWEHPPPSPMLLGCADFNLNLCCW